MREHECDVVIATRNRPGALRRCFEGLRGQTFTDFGVIVVDDASDTPAEEQVDSEAIQGLDVTFIRVTKQAGPASARNRGVAASRASYIVFIDDDVRAHPRLLEMHLDRVRESAEETRPVVSVGPFVEPEDWKPTPWNLWEARQARHEADSMVNGVYAPTWRQFHTGNNCLPRELFLRAGGFDEAFTRSEDDEFALRLHKLGARFVFTREAVALHYSERTLEAWLSIPRAYARFDVEIDVLHPGEGYLAAKQRELGKRNPMLRAYRSVFNGRYRTRPGVWIATTVARVLYRARLKNAAVLALSAAYDLSYTGALAEALAVRQRGNQSPGLTGT